MYKCSFYSKGVMHLWDDKNGYVEIDDNPYSYTIDDDGEYQSMYGDKLSKINGNDGEFESDLNPEMRILRDLYLDNDEPPKHHTILNFDIEVEMNTGRPDVDNPQNEITSIACHDNITKTYTVFILDKDSKIKNTIKDNVEIISCINENNLLMKFLNKWKEINPDIIIGWNSDKFDIPYLYNRMVIKLGRTKARELSRIGVVKYNKIHGTYRIAGRYSLDYMKLYKKFTFEEKESYSLDAISRHEVDQGKVEYDGTLDTLFAEDIDKFIEYNVTDVELVNKIDEKLQFINLAIGISHIGHVPYDDIFYSSRYLDGAILTYLKRHNLVAPNKRLLERMFTTDVVSVGDTEIHVKGIDYTVPKVGTLVLQETETSTKYKYKYSDWDGETFVLEKPIDMEIGLGWSVKYFFEGAYVEDVIAGKYEWLYSLDLESLYPSIIRSLNISPETKIGKILDWDKYNMMSLILDGKFIPNGDLFSFLDPELILKIQFTDGVTKNVKASSFIDTVKGENYRIASNGAIYRSDKRGVIPELLTTWFAQRKKFKALKKEYSKSGDIEKEAYYDRLQHIQKILLNSMYGVLGLAIFRFYDLDNAEATTLTGQDVIKFSQRVVKGIYKKDYGIDESKIIYSDTDSVVGDSVLHTWNFGITTIERLFDDLSSSETVINKQGREFIYPKDVRVPYLNESTYKRDYGRIEYIERHKVNKEIFRVNTKHGKYVDVTEDHSVMVFVWDEETRKGSYIEKKPTELEKGDKVSIINHFIKYSKVTEVESLGKIDDYVYDIGMVESPHTFYANDILVHNSMYINFPEEVKKDKDEAKLLDGFIRHSGYIETKVNDLLKGFAKKHLNTDECYLNFKREKITKSGFWVAKKNYAQLVKWDEGKFVDKIDIKGLATVRSSFPIKFKHFMNDIIKYILYNKDNDFVNEFIFDFRDNLSKDLILSEIATTSAIKTINDYDFDNPASLNDFKKKTPSGVKSAIAYNRLLDYFECDYKYEKMKDTDKVKVIYLKENPYGLESLAFNNYNDPQEILDIIKKYIDVDKVYDRSLSKKIDTFYKAVDWTLNKKIKNSFW